MASSSSSFSSLSAKAPPFVPPSTFFSKAPPFVPPNFNRSSIIGSPYYSLAKAPPYFNRSSIIRSPYCPDRFPYSYYEGGVALEHPCNFEDFQRVSVGPWNAPFSKKEVGFLWSVPSLGLQGGVSLELQCNFKDFQRVSVGPWKALFSEKVRQYDESKRVKFLQSRGGVSPELPCNFEDFHRVSVGSWKASFSEKVRQYDESKRVKFLQSRGVQPKSSACALSSHLSMSTSASESCNPPSNSSADCNGASTTVITVDSSTAKIGLSNSSYESPLVEPIKLHESQSIKHDNHMEDSSETAGQLEDVDSPCWKGTLAYRRPPFHFNEAVTPHLTSVQSITEVHPYIPATDGDAKTTFSVENFENLISDETKLVSSIPHSEKTVGVSFSCLQKRFEYPDILESEGNCKGNQCVDIGREQRADLTKDNQKIPEVLWLDQGITGSSFNQPRIADDITMHESGHKDALQNRSSEIRSCDVDVTGHNVTFESHVAHGHSGQPSSAGEHTQLIDETLQCLRKKLLSHADKNDNSLKELHNDVLLLVNDYHEAYVLKKKKVLLMGPAMDLEAGLIGLRMEDCMARALQS